MAIQMQILFGVVLSFALTGFTGSFPMPAGDDVDIPDVFPAVLPRYELSAFKEDLTDHPVVIAATSNVQNSLSFKNSADKRVDNEEALNGVDENILEALMDVEALGKLLQVYTEYIENRRKEDPSWPTTLAAKVGSKHATKDEVRLFNEDLQNAVSSIVVMKMMEQRLSLINTYVRQTVAAHPDTSFQDLFGEKGESVLAIQTLFELKYFEGVLHSVNTMIEESLTGDDSNSDFSSFGVIPGQPQGSLDDDVTFGIGAFIILVFTAIGFFFVLFLIVYLSLKAVRKCFENRANFDKKSKYEQI